jgi:hypothetical protein
VICAGTWLFFVVIAPFAIDQLLTRLYPVAPHATLGEADRSAVEQASRQPRQQQLDAFLSSHREVRVPPDLSDLGRLYLERAALVDAIDRIRQSAQDRWAEQLQSQQTLADRCSWLSPPALLTNALIELAGTGRSCYLHFMGQKRQFEPKYDALFLPRRLALPNSIFSAVDYSTIPIMHYGEQSAGEVLQSVACGSVGLVLAMPVAARFWRGIFSPYRRSTCSKLRGHADGH